MCVRGNYHTQCPRRPTSGRWVNTTRKAVCFTEIRGLLMLSFGCQDWSFVFFGRFFVRFLATKFCFFLGGSLWQNSLRRRVFCMRHAWCVQGWCVFFLAFTLPSAFLIAILHMISFDCVLNEPKEDWQWLAGCLEK